MAIHKILGPARLIATPGVEWIGAPAPVFASGAAVGTSHNVTGSVRDYNVATDTITVLSGAVPAWCSFNGTAFTVVTSPAPTDDFGPITLRCARVGATAANSPPFNVVVTNASDIIFDQGTQWTEDISPFYPGFNPAYHETVQASGSVPSGVAVQADAKIAYNGTGPGAAPLAVTVRGRHKTLQPPALVATVGTSQPQALDLNAYCLGAGITGARTYALNASSSALPPGWSISMNRYMAYNGSGAAGSAANVIIDATDNFGNSQSFTVEIEGTLPVANTVVGISGGSFTINGVATFLLGVSYFDVMNYKTQDLDYLQSNGWNMVRVWGEMWAGGSGSRAIDSSGNFVGSATVRAFCQAADARGIVVQFTVLDWESSPLSAAPITAITNAVTGLADLSNVIFDLCNEHGHTGTYDDHSGVAASTENMRIAAKTANPNCILTVSSDQPHFFDATTGNTMNASVVNAELNITQVDYLQPHCLRTADWYSQTDVRVAQLVAHCASVGKVRPIGLFEENRRNGTWGQPTQANFEQAATECKQAGGAGWLLHNSACFNNSSGTLESRLDSVEKATIVSLPPLIFAPVTPATGFTLTQTGRVGRQYPGGNDHMGYGWGNPATIAQRARELHCHAIRDGLQWDFGGETSAGVYGFKPSGGDPKGADIFTEFANQATAGWDVFLHYVVTYFYNPIYSGQVSQPAFRAYIVNWCKSIVNEWIAAGRNPARLVLNMGNEINSNAFGEYGIDVDDGLGVQNYGILCKEVRAAVRAINPAVRIQVGEGVDGAHSYYNTWTANLIATPNFWTQAVDIISTHEYHDVHPHLAHPEELYNRFVPWAQNMMNAAAAAGRTDVTVAISESGYTISDAQYPDSYQTKSLGRMAFLYSVVPGVEFIILYALRDNDQSFGWVDGSTYAVRTNRGLAIRDAFEHLSLATSRARYDGDGANGDVGIVMEVPAANGGRRAALWNLATRNLSGFQVTANQIGTLRLQKPGGSTTTRSLAAGTNTLADIPLNDTPTVLHTTDGTVIDFPQLYLPSTGGGSTADEDFAYRRSRPGHVRSFGFDSIADLGPALAWENKANYGVVPGTGSVDIDTNTKASGGGALRFSVLAGSGGSASWFTNFWPDLSKLYGANSSFFIQWKERISQTIFDDWGRKHCLIGSGDDGVTQYSSCTDIEIEMEPYSNANGVSPAKQFPVIYNACPTSCGGIFPFYETLSGGVDYDLQNARPAPYCLYGDNTHAGCKFIVPNSWMVFQIGVDVGPRITMNGHYWFQNSRVRAWMQSSPGAAEDLFLDYTVGLGTPGSPPGLCAGHGATGNQRYGKIWLMNYTQNNVANPRAGNIWYDELIISEQKIPAAAA